MSELILIIEDEVAIQNLIEVNLQAAGFRTQVAGTGRRGLDLSRHEVPAIVLLDLNLPDISGIDVCRSLKSDAATADVPVIMVTARTDEVDRVVGFELGADDYVPKPFSPRELVLRVRAVLKRSRRARARDSGEVIRFREIVIDQGRHRVTVNGEEVTLTALEFKLLVTLLDRRGRVQSRERLLDDVWGLDVEVTTRTVDTHVKRLREKLAACGEYIETVRGIGYRFRERED